MFRWVLCIVLTIVVVASIAHHRAEERLLVVVTHLGRPHASHPGITFAPAFFLVV